jgi:AAHS family 4-hydroxybenzoate transporter-like MFS transporter
MMIVTNGFTIGAMIGGFLSAWLIPTYGWRSVFVVGGVVPLLLLGPMFAWLPESFGREQRRERFPLARLFADGRAVGTVLLWTVNFMNVLNAYFVSSWLPTVVRGAGYPTETAVLVGASVQTGGVLGTLALGWVLPRVGFVPVLTVCFLTAAVNLALIGQPGLALPLLFLVAFLAGLGIFAGQPGLNALAATFYPTEMRSTGIGSGLGIGRFGAFIGPLVAGELMRNQWTTQDLFHAAAIPAAISAMAIVALRWTGRVA